MLDDFINEKNLNLLNNELLEMNKEYLLTNGTSFLTKTQMMRRICYPKILKGFLLKMKKCND